MPYGGEPDAKVTVGVETDLSRMKKGLGEAGDRWRSFGQSMIAAGTGFSAAVTGPIVAAGMKFTQTAMEAVESENLFEVSLGESADSVRAWSENLRSQLGLNAYEVRKQAGTFYVMLESMGLTREAAEGMSKDFSMLAYDMASFYNLEVEDAFMKLQAGITGEIEPLKRLGIVVNENTIKMAAYEAGIGNLVMENGKLKGSLTEQEKIHARYLSIMKQTGKAQGDLARTIDSPVNALRVFGQQVEDFKIRVGQAIIPFVTQFMKYGKQLLAILNKLNDRQIGALVKVLAAVAAIGPMMLGIGQVANTVAAIAKAGVMLKPVAKYAGLLGRAILGIGKAAAPAKLGLTAILTGGGAVAAVVAAIAGAGYLIYKNWDKIAPLLERVGKTFNDIIASPIKEFWQGITTEVGAVAASYNMTNEAAAKLLEKQPQLAKGAAALSTPYERLKYHLDGLVRRWDEFLEAVGKRSKWQTVRKFADFLRTVIDGIRNIILRLADLWGRLQRAVEQIDWEPFIGFLNALGLEGDTLIEIFDALAAKFYDIYRVVYDFLFQAFDGLLKLFGPLIDHIDEFVNGIGSFLEWLTPLVEGVNEMKGALGDVAVALLDLDFSAAADALMDFNLSLADFGTTVLEQLTGWNPEKEDFSEWAGGVWDAVLDAIADAIDDNPVGAALVKWLMPEHTEANRSGETIGQAFWGYFWSGFFEASSPTRWVAAAAGRRGEYAAVLKDQQAQLERDVGRGVRIEKAQESVGENLISQYLEELLPTPDQLRATGIAERFWGDWWDYVGQALLKLNPASYLPAVETIWDTIREYFSGGGKQKPISPQIPLEPGEGVQESPFITWLNEQLDDFDDWLDQKMAWAIGELSSWWSEVLIGALGLGGEEKESDFKPFVEALEGLWADVEAYFTEVLPAKLDGLVAATGGGLLAMIWGALTGTGKGKGGKKGSAREQALKGGGAGKLGFFEQFELDLSTWFSSLPTKFDTWVKGLGDRIAKWWNGLGKRAADETAKGFEGEQKDITDRIAEVLAKAILYLPPILVVVIIKTVREIGAEFKRQFDALKTAALDWLWDTGWNVVQGLWSGVKAAIDNGIGWFEAQLRRLDPGARKATGTDHSPSWKMKLIGQDMIAGLKLGLADIETVTEWFTGKVGELGGSSSVNLAYAAAGGSAIRDEAGGGGGTNVTHQHGDVYLTVEATVSSEIDIQHLADRLNRLLDTQRRAEGTR